ncbi:hypothetical protein V1520DRAFT_349379 [Lipomyces starkeyi]|uniref:DUF1748-domain-containing protein n=1 Tax=Lipomyces starkeyi NRRL Y-11557 TaxID=675824 RepID=A0A1E3QDK2_LIPST|nr:hypothetical protein LIPSTDRAFT_68411 [Lipomyces starkeyi NRRL Y-11557]
MTFGKIIHLSFDLVLVSTVLAGVKRSTGLVIKTEDIGSSDIRYAVDRYLGVGEWVLDASVTYMSNSPYFTRKR